MSGIRSGCSMSKGIIGSMQMVVPEHEDACSRALSGHNANAAVPRWLTGVAGIVLLRLASTL